MDGLSIRGYARHRGVSHTAVRKALASGRITANDDGTINPTTADEDWAASTDVSKPRNSVTGRPQLAALRLTPRRVSAASAVAEPPPLSTGGQSRLASSYADSRAARESYLARLAKLEFEERSSKLVDADEVRAQVFALGRRMRDAVLALPDRVAPLIVGQSDPAVIHRILTEEIQSCLSELAVAPSLRVLEREETRQ